MLCKCITYEKIYYYRGGMDSRPIYKGFAILCIDVRIDWIT